MAVIDELKDKEQGFLSHLIELRDRLMKMLLAVVLLFIPLFIIRDKVYTWLSAPLSTLLPEGEKMIAYEIASPFLIPVKLALLVSVFIAIPFLLYQIWAFVAPGLYKHEKRLVAPLLASSTLLFYSGALFAYYVVFPLAFGFLVSVSPENVSYNPDIARYLDFVLAMFFAFGLAFEVPVATVLLVITGVTTPEKLIKMRPYVFVGAFILGMFLTPPDVISQILLAVPMYVLFEAGVFLSKYFKVWVKEAFDERDKMHDDEGDADENVSANTASEPASESTNEPSSDQTTQQATENKIGGGSSSAGKPTPTVKGGYRNSMTDHDESDDSDAWLDAGSDGPYTDS